MSAELIFRRGTPPDAEYTFKHALVQDAAYSTLLRSRRQQIHARIAATLEGQFPEIVEAQPELLARHCAEAGLIEKAVGYWLKAGQQAIARWAMTEAVAQLRKGLDLLSGMPDGAARQEQELDLQITLGHALIATKGIRRDRSRRGIRSRASALRAIKPAAAIVAGSDRPICVSPRPRGAEAGGTPCRGDASAGEVRKTRFGNVSGSQPSGNICFFLGKFIDARAYCENALALWDPNIRASAVPRRRILT